MSQPPLESEPIVRILPQSVRSDKEIEVTHRTQLNWLQLVNQLVI